MISSGNATVYVANLDEAVRFYTERLGLKLTNRVDGHWATVQTGPSYWTTDEVGAGLTIGLHPPSSRAAAPGTAGGVGYGLETYEPIESVVERLAGRGVRVDQEIVRFEAGNVVSLIDQDGLATYVHEFPPDMIPETDLEGIADGGAEDDPATDMISGGHAIVYVSDMSRAIAFYTKTLGLKLTYRYEDKWATTEAGRLVLAIHPQTPRTPVPGTKGSVALGLTLDEPIQRVISLLTSRGVRIAGSIERSEQGRFVAIEDPDGNPIHLWDAKAAASGTPEMSGASTADTAGLVR